MCKCQKKALIVKQMPLYGYPHIVWRRFGTDDKNGNEVVAKKRLLLKL